MPKARKGKPSPRMRRVASKILVNIGSGKGVPEASLGKAMREEGYSDTYSKNPGQLQETQGWQELMDHYMPNSLVGHRHRQVLDKKEILLRNNNETGEIEQINTGQPHSDVKSGLDMAYKLKGFYAAEVKKIHIDTGPTDEEIDAELEFLVPKKKMKEKNHVAKPSPNREQPPKIPQAVQPEKPGKSEGTTVIKV
jgi:hypothetical protein